MTDIITIMIRQVYFLLVFLLLAHSGLTQQTIRSIQHKGLNYELKKELSDSMMGVDASPSDQQKEISSYLNSFDTLNPRISSLLDLKSDRSNLRKLKQAILAREKVDTTGGLKSVEFELWQELVRKLRNGMNKNMESLGTQGVGLVSVINEKVLIKKLSYRESLQDLKDAISYCRNENTVVYKSMVRAGKMEAAEETLAKSKKELVKDMSGQYARLLTAAYTGNAFHFFPVNNAYSAEFLYKGEVKIGSVDYLQNARFSITQGLNSGAVFVEVAESYFGPVRVALGTMVARTELQSLTSEDVIGKDSTAIRERLNEIESENSKNLTAQNLLAGGGNGLISAALPLLAFVGGDWINGQVSINATAGFAFPDIGTTSSNTKANFSEQLVGGFWLTPSRGDFNLVFNFIAGLYQSRELNQLVEGDRDSFKYFEASIGLEVFNSVRLRWNFPRIFDAGGLEEDFVKSSITVELLNLGK